MADEFERLTPKQAEALRVELEELEGPRRIAVVAAIKTAREFGDLSENFEYHAAKNEQGLLEARIRTLRARLDHAIIVEEATGDEVSIGSIVEVEDEPGEHDDGRDQRRRRLGHRLADLAARLRAARPQGRRHRRRRRAPWRVEGDGRRSSPGE